MFDFPQVIFRQILQKFKKLFSRFPVSFFETHFWLGLRLKTPTNKKFHGK